MAKCAMMENKAGNFKDSLPFRPAYPLVNWPKSLGVGWGQRGGLCNSLSFLAPS